MKVSVVTFLVGLVTSAAALPDAAPVADADAGPKALPDADAVALPDAAADAIAASVGLSDPEGRLDPEKPQGDTPSGPTPTPFFGYNPTTTTTTTTTTESSYVTVAPFARAHRPPRPTPTRQRLARLRHKQLGSGRNRANARVDIIKSIPVTFGKRKTLRDSITSTKVEDETIVQAEESEQDLDKPVFPPSQLSPFKPRPLARTASPTSKPNNLRLVKLRPLLSRRQSLGGPQSGVLDSPFLPQSSARSHRFAPTQPVFPSTPHLSPLPSLPFPSPSLQFSSQSHSFPDQASRSVFQPPFTLNPIQQGRTLSHASSHRFAVPSQPHHPHDPTHSTQVNSVFLTVPQDQFQPHFAPQPIHRSHGAPSPLLPPTVQPLHQRRRPPTPSSQIRAAQLLGTYILPDAHYKPKPKKVIQKTTLTPSLPLHQPAVTQAFPSVPSVSHPRPRPTPIPPTHAASIPQPRPTPIPPTLAAFIPQPRPTAVPHVHGTPIPQPRPTAIPHAHGASISQPRPTAIPHVHGASISQPRPTAIPHAHGASISQPRPTAIPHVHGASISQPRPTAIPHVHGASISQPRPTAIPHVHGASISQPRPTAIPHAHGASITQALPAAVHSPHAVPIAPSHAASIPQPQPAAIPSPHAATTPEVHPAQERYDVGWTVQDNHYGTHFNQQETRRKGRTQGSYSVLLPDGRLQTVNYYVDGNSGYVAEVTYSTPAASTYGNEKDTYSSYTQV